MTTITIDRALLEQALKALELGFEDYDASAVEIETEAIQALRAELAKPVETITTGMAVERLCQALRDDLDYAWSWHCNVAMTAYDAGCPHDAANEGAARFMQLLAGVDTRQHIGFAMTQTEPMATPTPAPAWHDALEVAAIKAERDELLKLINRRKIHPHDIPLEIFLADLSTRTANVLRAEFDSLKFTGGTYGFESPFTVRHVLMFSRKEIKKWPGIGKKGLNEIEENLRARGLQLWNDHDDRSLRLLREHKSYFAAIGDKGELGALKPDRDAMEKDAERYRWLAAYAKAEGES